MNHTFNNNNNNTNNNINNIDSNTNVTTTTATTTTMTNNLVSVSCGGNNDLQNNKHNNNSNSSSNTTNNNNNNSSSSNIKPNTLQLNATTKNLLITDHAYATDIDAKATVDAADADADADADAANEPKQIIDALVSTGGNDNSTDMCERIMNENRKQKQNKTDREKDLQRECASSTNPNSANSNTKWQQCQQQTSTTKTTTTHRTTVSSDANIDKCDTGIESIISKNMSVSNNSTSKRSGNESSGGTMNNGNASLNFLNDTKAPNGVSSSGKQLILNITEPHAIAVTDDKLNSIRAHQKQRHSQRRLRTKALLDSLPKSMKMLGCAEQVGDYEVLIAGSDELLQRLSINNPFYCFRKQSNSLKEMRALTCNAVERRLRKVHSDTDIFSWQLVRNVDRQSNDAAMVPERFARIVLECTGEALLGMRDMRSSVWHCYAPRKRGDTAVQLTDTDGSVVVVLDNKHSSLVSKPKSLNSLEELLSDSSAEGAEYNARGYLLDAAAAEHAFAVSTHEADSSTVITNPFSIFLDDDMQAEHFSANARLRAASSASQQQRSLKKRQRSERSIRRLFEGGSVASAKRALDNNTKQQTNENARQHYLNGIPVSRFERQDFVNTNAAITLSTSAKSHKLKPRHVFKNLSLRKMHKSASGLPATTYATTTNAADTISDLPQMKKLKITYPNRTQSIHSALDVSASVRLNIALVSPSSAGGSGKYSYFERIQAKTRQGLQKLRDKCRNFKHASAGHQQYASNGSGFSTLAKDDSFRFIGDRARISSYESKCAALNANASGRQQATIYKSYKSEIDLSKNLHYLDAYLEENFEQNLRSTKQSAHSVGRVAAGRLQRQRQIDNSDMRQSENSSSPRYSKPLRGRTHKRSLSAAQKSLTTTEQRAPTNNNYENLGTLPIAKRGCSDSLSSSDYASVFSGPTLAVEQATPVSSIGATDPITPSLADDTSSSAGLRYEHPKMSQYFYNKLAVEGSANLLLSAEEQRCSETANSFFNTSNEDDLTDERSDFMSLGAGGDPALLVDYRRAANLDDSIRILVNEAEDKDFQLQQHRESHVKQQCNAGATSDWHRPEQEQLSAADERNFLLAYNENLAESHFYRSLNQHLQQQQRDIYLDVEENGVLGIDAAVKNERRDDKDLHYESYLDHFYHAKSGQHTRKANSIGYDDERVGTIGVNGIDNEDDGAESGYVARSAFRRAARGKKAGGSAFELRHSALLLLGEQQGNKTAQDVTTTPNHAASYARQLYHFNVDVNTAALAPEESAYSVDADKVKLTMTDTFVATPKPLGANLIFKSRQQQDNIVFGGTNTMSLAPVEQQNERQLNMATNLLETPKSTINSLYATDAYNSYLATAPNGMKDINSRHFYNEAAPQNSTANALITLPVPADSKTPTKFQQQSGSGIKANIYLQAQQQAPSTAASALFIDGKKHGGNPEQSMAASCGDASNPYMLDNIRRHYQPQQQLHQQPKPTNSVSSSLSLSTSSSSNSSVSQPMVHNQQHQQQQLLLPTATTHAKPIKPQQHQPAYGASAYHVRRNSTASNASSSDNFDTFIALRSAKTTNDVELPSPASINSAALQTDYLLSTKRTNIANNSSSNASAYQQRQHMLVGAHTRTHAAVHYPTSPSSGGSSGTVPLISALNYYGTSGGSSSHSDATHAAYASSTASASASASSSSSSSSTHHRYALTANASAIASNNYALLAQMHYANKGGAAVPIGSVDSAVGNACITGTPISPVYASERKPFILEYEC